MGEVKANLLYKVTFYPYFCPAKIKTEFFMDGTGKLKRSTTSTPLGKKKDVCQ